MPRIYFGLVRQNTEAYVQFVYQLNQYYKPCESPFQACRRVPEI